jgi:hypothetical protein
LSRRGVDTLHTRQPSTFDRSLTQPQQTIATAASFGGGVGPAFERRRRRTEDDFDGALAGTEDSQVARRIADAVLLFEGGVVLLVDDDQAELGQRREDGQAGAEHDARFAGQGGAPVAAARGLAELAVQTDQPGGGKTRCDAGFKLWGQIDFRDQQQ